MSQVVLDPAQFDAALAAARSSHSRVFVYVVASNDPATGQAWCPDVRSANPLVHAAFSGQKEVALIEAHVGDRPTWKTPTNFYRTHKLLNATNVPTLYEITEDGAVGRVLVESEITAPALKSLL